MASVRLARIFVLEEDEDVEPGDELAPNALCRRFRHRRIVERTFARLLAMGAPERRCTTLPHTERELNVRVNKPIVESVLEITLAALLRR